MMVRIRKANYFDKFRLKKVIPYIGAEVIESYTKGFIDPPFAFLHDLLPINMKFLPETHVLEEDRSIIGMITVCSKQGNPHKLDISRLYLEHDYFNAGKQLIEYIISKYGAKGASTFIATIDDSHQELMHLFVDGCGFRQCSSEQLWKMDKIRFTSTENTFFRPFKNSDAQAVAMLFNDSIITHFKHSISRTKDEYLEPIFKGLSKDSQFKYVIEDEKLKTIKGYFSISTSDNINYIIDVTTSPWYEYSWDDIFNFATNEINKRQKEFSLFTKLKKFTTNAETFEKYLTEQEFKCVQNQLVFVKDFYKPIKEPQDSQRIVFFNEVSEKPVCKNEL